MKSMIFNQRMTVFTNSYSGYSDSYKDILNSKFGGSCECGALQPNLAFMLGPQQIVNPNQIPQGAPWFIKMGGIRIEFQPNKIDVVSDLFIVEEDKEKTRILELGSILSRVNEVLPIGCITRIAYAPSWGLESEDGASVTDYWNSVIGISDMSGSIKQERMLRYNTPCKIDFGSHTNVDINRVVTLSEGVRTETPVAATKDNLPTSRSLECVIVTIDINTNGVNGVYTMDDVNTFCQKAQILGLELQKVINK